MKKYLSLLFLIPCFAFGQNMYNFNRATYFCASGGPSKYLGDIGGYAGKNKKKLVLDANTFFFGASIERTYKRIFSWELSLITGKLSASDANIKYTSINDPEYFRFRRNLDFRTNITEGSLLLNFYPMQIFNKKYYLHKMKIQPFIFGGVGVFKFNPQGSYYDPTYKTQLWIDLKPYHTEGQGYEEYPESKEYNLSQVNIPYGFGLTYFIADNLHVSFSLNGRKLFTDYLDDVSNVYIDNRLHDKYFPFEEDATIAKLLSDKSSFVDPFYAAAAGDTRGNAAKYDSFFNYNLKIAFRIGAKKSKKPTYYKYDDAEICDK